MHHQRSQLARRISPASLAISRAAMEEDAARVAARGTAGQRETLAHIFAGGAVGIHPAVEEVHTYECSRDGPDIVAHRTYRFQNTGSALNDFRTQLFRIDPVGVARCI